jgi:kynureninase
VDSFREQALALDEEDPIASLRDAFVIDDPEVIYLDGNSLGRLPVASRARLLHAIDQEWARDLISGWSRWLPLPREVGDDLGRVALGVDPGQVVVCDSTTTNLYKLAVAAVRARPGRGVVVTDDDNFPTDRYVLEEVARSHGLSVRVVRTPIDGGVQLDAVAAALDEDVALVSLSHVAYRSGALAPLREIDDLAHAVGALTLWDLSHTVGSVMPDLTASDLAVGCSYKYLNGGPGAPAWLYVRRDLQAELHNPVPGWFGHVDQFAMDSPYEPHPGVARFLTGTPGLLGLVAVQEGVRVLEKAGVPALQAKGALLTDFLLRLVEGVEQVRVATPLEATRRGSHVTLHHPRARQLTEALAARKVVVDYREPDRMRWGTVPAYTRFVDVYDAVQRLRELLA